MRKLIIAALIISLILLLGVATAEETALPLKLIKALPVVYHERVDPSGLTIYDNTLFAVSDKHDDTIFKLQITDDEAIMVPHLKFRFAEPVARLDLEGITCDSNGVFYLVSETLYRVLRVDPREEYASWVTPSVRPFGEEKGLFQVRNAALEGIAVVGADQFVVCVERQPRGIVEIDMSIEPCEIKAFAYDRTNLKLPENRRPDFTDLFFEDQVLYALHRNSYAISKLIRNGETFEEKDFWSYRSIETGEELQYSNMTFGRAEGFCMDKERVFVILDNNGDHRLSDPEDRRPLLLIMQRPQGIP
jgi:hypothetical protein